MITTLYKLVARSLINFSGFCKTSLRVALHLKHSGISPGLLTVHCNLQKLLFALSDLQLVSMAQSKNS